MTGARTGLFDYSFRAAGRTDAGKKRRNNQDEVLLLPELGFFAVSDGMGGLENGAQASEFVVRSVGPLMGAAAREFAASGDPEAAGRSFLGSVRLMSDSLYEAGNTPSHFPFGATFVGVWLLRDRAIFCCLGDSRGYCLPKRKKNLRQITDDHNMASLLVKTGKLTKAQAKNHPSGSRLTAFVGMPPPATPEVFSVETRPGDRIMLCSDGLYGPLEEDEVARALRSSRDPDRTCRRLVDMANDKGGPDNISVVHIAISA
ncbi:MAG: protein phosphatase 2C domain-containing protein [Deltaproteobacteria bacterium]|jgi:serine/threonine protein phosphatase PrpC|nr:protein phosphatase 2C domain-containing protein [Deltaproteobacteria bacterium]